VAYPELVDWSVTFWGPKGPLVGRCDPESDPGGFQVQKRLKNESSQNQTKPIPLRPARRVDSGHIFTFSNGLCMRELSHSDHFSKQLKSQQVNWQKSMMMSA
jgi:hypothetical protein